MTLICYNSDSRQQTADAIKQTADAITLPFFVIFKFNKR